MAAANPTPFKSAITHNAEFKTEVSFLNEIIRKHFVLN